MNTKVKALLVVVGLIVAFGSGWLVAKVQARNKVSIDKVWADQWIDGVVLLARHGNGTELIKPEQIPLIIGQGLDGQSFLLGKLFDSLTPAIQEQLMFYIPAAHAIAIEQQGPSAMQNRRHLLTFVDCMQKVQTQGGSVQKCVERNKK